MKRNKNDISTLGSTSARINNSINPMAVRLAFLGIVAAGVFAFETDLQSATVGLSGGAQSGQVLNQLAPSTSSDKTQCLKDCE